jgi:uncharacterized membrane-anchored protein
MDDSNKNLNIVGLDKAEDKQDSLSERKARLLRQGDFYRAGIVRAKSDVKHGARPDTLFHSALDHATWAVRSRLDGLLKPTGISVAALMPYAMSILGFLRRRQLVKPALGVAAVAGGVALFLQHRRRVAQ